MDTGNTAPAPKQDMNDWFKSIDSAPGGTPAQAPKRPSKKIIFILAIGIVIALTAGIVGAIYLSKPVCLTASEYQEFNQEQAPEGFDSTSDFYSNVYFFAPGTADYAEGSADDIAQSAKKLGEFYKKYNGRPMAITLTATPQSDTQNKTDVAAARVEKIKSALVQAGIAADAIHVNPSEPVPESDEPSDIPDAVTLQLTSVQPCR